MDILLAYLAVAHFDRRNASPGQVAFCGAVDRLPATILYWDRCWRRPLEVGRQMPLTGAGAAAHESTKKLMEKVMSTPKKRNESFTMNHHSGGTQLSAQNVFSLVEALGARRELAEATLRIVDLFEPLLNETFKQY